MEARVVRIAVAILALWNVAATYRTRNFVVVAPSESVAKQVGEYGEHYRVELAKLWLGNTLPNWSKPCMVRVELDKIGAGGETNFVFDRGEVSGWDMRIQGSVERILDSVLPHEICHTIFASHFRRPLPRWADEGAATLCENESERRRQMILCRQILGSAHQIDFRTMLKMMDYPQRREDVLHLYAQGYVLCDLLVQKGGRRRYLDFLETAHRQGWEAAAQKHYGFDSAVALEKEWHSWLVAGCPALEIPAGQQIAANQPREQANPDSIARSQTPDDNTVNIRELAAANPLPQPRDSAASQTLNGRLEAPDPSRGTRDSSSMVAQFELGTGHDLSDFAADHAEYAAPQLGPSGNRRAEVGSLHEVADPLDVPETSRRSEPPRVNPAPQKRPSAQNRAVADRSRYAAGSSGTRQPAPRMPTARTSSGARSLRTPPLSLSSRPQLGASQDFPSAG